MLKYMMGEAEEAACGEVVLIFSLASPHFLSPVPS